MDRFTPEQRRKTMQAIRGKDTGIEIKLRKELWSRGVHYRKNCNSVYGRPDLAFIGKKVAVFCDSEFWHGYEWEKNKEKIGSNRGYWIPKIERNMSRDKEVNEKLTSDGWTVIRFWGREIQRNVSGCADQIIAVLIEKGNKNSKC